MLVLRKLLWKASGYLPNHTILRPQTEFGFYLYLKSQVSHTIPFYAKTTLALPKTTDLYTHIMSNQSQPIRNTGPIHLLNISLHQHPPQPPSLKLRQNSHRMQYNGPPSLLMTQFRRLWVRGIPISWIIHRRITSRQIIRLRRNNMPYQDTDRSIFPARLNRMASIECFGFDTGAWNYGTEYP
jgi:hypothetical protein